MRVNNRTVRAGNHEATSRSRTLVDGGRNCVRGEHQPNPNPSRAYVGGPSHGGHSSEGGGGGGSSSSHGSGRRAGGGDDRGGRGHTNSHATGNARGNYDARHKIDEIRRAKKTTKVSDSDDFPAYSA
jgi:hypothetical protein